MNSPIALLKLVVSSKYKLIARGMDEAVSAESGWSDNIITTHGDNQFFALMGGSLSAYAPVRPKIVVGTGSSAPVKGDTALAAFRAGAAWDAVQAGADSTSTISYDDDYVYCEISMRQRFPQGAASGNISEVGCVWDTNVAAPTAASLLSSRALVRDSGGNPTSVPVLTDEFLDVIWRLRAAFPRKIVSTVPRNIKGVVGNSDCVVKAAAMTTQARSGDGFSFTYAPNTIGGSDGIGFPTNGTATPYKSVGEPDNSAATPPAGSTAASNASSSTLANYTTGSLYRDMTFTWGLNVGNIADINCFKVNFGLGTLWLYLTDGYKFTKTNQDQMSITIRFTF